METEIISSEIIKPSSPTPLHLKIHKLSLLDQIMFPLYTPIILYFAPDPTDVNISEKIQHLKNSLASALTTFYPLAGVIKDALSLDCNDAGVPFTVAKVGTRIQDFLQRPDILRLNNNLLPGEFNISKVPGPGDVVCEIRLNSFNCGGIAICIVFWHSAVDLAGLCAFLRAWAAAAAARGSCETATLNCIAQSAFPQNVALPSESNPFAAFAKLWSTGNCTTRRYVIDASSISILKAQSGVSAPSRVEVVTALIWKCFMDSVAEKDDDQQKPFVVSLSVNMRRRAEPPFPEDSFGNFMWPTAAAHTGHLVKCSNELVPKLRRRISRIDKEYVKRLQTDDGYCEKLEDCRNVIPEEAKLLSINSWVNIGLYDPDFGWGRPLWTSAIDVCSNPEWKCPNNFALLLDTRTGDGIEAWVSLDEKYVAGFQKNEEWKMHARFSPSVL